MIKVLRIINRFNLGGITFNVSYLSKYLNEDYETLLIGGPEESGEASSLHIPRSLGLDPLLLNEMRRSPDPLKDLKAYWRIRKIIREFRPQIVHTHASKAGALGRLAAIHENVPVIVHTFHGHVFKGYFGKLGTRFFLSIERYLASKSSAVVAISDIQKKELGEIYRVCKPERIQVVPLGFDLEKFRLDITQRRQVFRQKWGIAPDEVLLGIIGRLAPIKNHALFVDAASQVIAKSGRRVRALIVGDGETRASIVHHIHQSKRTCGEAGKDNADFLFAGWIKEVEEILPAIDIVCLTSNNEGTPVSLIEAQAAGRFIVSTDVGGIRDILYPDRGYLSPAGDKKQYTDNLMKAVQEIETLNQNSEAASKLVIERFSYKRLCSDMDALYKKLLAEKQLTA